MQKLTKFSIQFNEDDKVRGGGEGGGEGGTEKIQ